MHYDFSFPSKKISSFVLNIDWDTRVDKVVEGKSIFFFKVMSGLHGRTSNL